MEKKTLIKEGMIEKVETGNGLKAQTYKNVLEKAQRIAKDEKSEILTDDMIYTAAKRELKQLQDVLPYVTNDNVRKEETEKAMEYLKEVLPVTLSKESLLEYLRNEKIEKNMGACMKSLKIYAEKYFDGAKAKKAVEIYLSE